MSGPLRVWAPAAEAVAAVVDGAEQAMAPEGGGWWRTGGDVAAGARYAFRLDGGPPRPDPRSRHQPDGVDGPSQVVDPAAFTWHDQAWRGCPLPGAVLYELHVGTFSPEGTFDGAIARLGHLVDLGVDAVEVMPIAQFPGERGWGYDGVDLYATHHAYGGPAGFQRFVDACHQAGLGVVLDVVYNHLGPLGNFLGEFGPYFSDRHQTGWGPAVNLDGPGSDEVRAFIVGNATMWLRDYHVDGLRLDAVHALVDTSATHLLEQLAEAVATLAAQVRRPLFVVAESDLNDPRLVRGAEAGGYGLDAAWADEWHHALHAVLTGERDGYYEDFGTWDQLGKALRQAWVYDGTWSPHRQRTFGRSPAGLAGDRFVVCAQNHDQVGNRAQGDRLSALVGPGRLRVAATLLLTAPFTPLLFQGEEWGASTPFQYFTDHPDPELGRAVREGRRHEFAAFGWDPEAVPDPQDRATFERSRLDWGELGAEPHAGLLAWTRELLALRRALPALADPDPARHRADVDEAGLVTVARGPVVVLANLGPEPREVDAAELALVARSDPAVALAGGRLTVPPDTAAILAPR